MEYGRQQTAEAKAYGRQITAGELRKADYGSMAGGGRRQNGGSEAETGKVETGRRNRTILTARADKQTAAGEDRYGKGRIQRTAA